METKKVHEFRSISGGNAVRLGHEMSRNGIYFERIGDDIYFSAIYDGNFDLCGEIVLSVAEFCRLMGITETQQIVPRDAPTSRP